MFDIDDAMADVVVQSTQPALAAIKLAWWRERLQELDADVVPAEPRLRAAAEELLPRGVTGADLAVLEDGWAGLLTEQGDDGRVASRGETLFEIGARLLGVETVDANVRDLGRLYGTISIRRLGLADLTALSPDPGKVKMPKEVRPLTAFAALASLDQRDLMMGSEGTPRRAWALLRHRLTGRL